MSPLNENQIRHVEATFAHVDSLLRSIENVTRSDLSPFARERADVEPDEARLIHSFVTLVRARMLGALDRLGIRRPLGKISARWSADTSLTFADISLSGLGASDLAGYGTVDTETAGELEALAADLRSLLQRARQGLHEHDAGGLATRIASIRGAAGDVLRALDVVSRDHALAEVRPLLAAAAERATSTTFDVGVFGRVSAGKSSLINALIGAAVLPVGATPVTAVPLRLARGDRAATLQLIDGSQREITVDSIFEYATEERNPENRMGVRAIEISVPSVPEGLRLLDTPGVGSLNASGPASAFAWLPRCDLGLVLIAAGTAVGRDDLALTTGLQSAGIRCVVILSKADLLAPGEVEPAMAYVRRALNTSVSSATRATDGSAVSDFGTTEVYAVSMATSGESRLAAFRREALAPLARDHTRQAQRALGARLHRLVEATALSLSTRRLDSVQPDSADGAPAELVMARVNDRAVRVQRARIRAMAVLRKETDRIGDTTAQILDTAAEAVVAAWSKDHDGRDAARLAIIGSASNSLRVVRDQIDVVRRSTSQNARVGRSTDSGPAESPEDGTDRRRIPPLFDPEFLDALPELPPPAMTRRLLGRTVALHRLDAIAKPLHEALQRYGNALYEWGRAALEELATGASDSSWAAHDGGFPDGTASTIDPELEVARVALAVFDASTDDDTRG